MGHPQPKTPMQTDNTAAQAVVTNNVQPRRTKAMDMWFHWLRDRAAQNQFRIYWRRGPSNRGDYYTKHFAGAHHRSVRPEILTPWSQLEDLRRRQQRARMLIKLYKQFSKLPEVFFPPRGCARLGSPSNVEAEPPRGTCPILMGWWEEHGSDSCCSLLHVTTMTNGQRPSA